MWTIFKDFIKFVTILFLLYVLVFWLQGMWDLSLLNKDWTCTAPLPPLVMEGDVWTTRPPGKSQYLYALIFANIYIIKFTVLNIFKSIIQFHNYAALHSWFLEYFCFPSAWKVSSESELKRCLLLAVRTPLTLSSIVHAYLLLVSVGECLCIVGPPKVCTHEASWTLCTYSVEERVYCTLPLWSHACSIVLLYCTK